MLETGSRASSSGSFILGRTGVAPVQRGRKSWGPWKSMLLAGIHKTGMPVYRGPVSHGGQDRMARRQRHHSGLWCDLFTTELDAEGQEA